MIVYQVTVLISHEAEKEWTLWMRDQHIPAVMATGYFSGFRFTKDGLAHIIEYDCETLEKLTAYQAGPAVALQKEHSERYAGHFTASRKII